MYKIIKLPQALEILSISKATFFKQRNQKLIPTAIKLGSQSVGYIKTEIEAVLMARIQGNDNNAIKQVVINLESKRVEAK